LNITFNYYIKDFSKSVASRQQLESQKQENEAIQQVIFLIIKNNF